MVSRTIKTTIKVQCRNKFSIQHDCCVFKSKVLFDSFCLIKYFTVPMFSQGGTKERAYKQVHGFVTYHMPIQILKHFYKVFLNFTPRWFVLSSLSNCVCISGLQMTPKMQVLKMLSNDFEKSKLKSTIFLVKSWPA